MSRKLEQLERLVADLQRQHAQRIQPVFEAVVIEPGAAEPASTGAAYRMVIHMQDSNPRCVASPAAPPQERVPGAYEWDPQVSPFSLPIRWAEPPSANNHAKAAVDGERSPSPPLTPPEGSYV